jgi:hypothetical protein
MRKPLVFLTLFFISSVSHLAIADAQTPSTQWDRNSAMAAVQTVDIRGAVHELSNISSLADGQSTLKQLKNLENRSDWPLPAREAAIQQFTRSLAGFPRDAISPVVLQYLRNYQSQTLVPHLDHPDAFIPLFNIRATAAGVENGWLRQEFAFEAETFIETDPHALVSAYAKASNPNQRYAYIEVLNNARMDEVFAVQDVALEQLPGVPSLTPVVASTAVITKDLMAIQGLLTNGKGVGISSALKTIGQSLPAAELSELLIFAIQQAPAINATMAMAAWSPRLRHQDSIRSLLIEKLADPELGASAALALAHQPDIQTIKILQDIAAGDSAAAQRAQMALDLNRNQLIGETQP